MNNLITAYLMLYRQCPLSPIGSLHMVTRPAVADVTENIISAPVDTVVFTPEEIPARHFFEFVARKNSITPEDASDMLANFCNNLSMMDAYGETVLAPAGKFFVDAEGSLQFRSAKLPPEYCQALAAKRVIHPSQVHNMLVGDRETDTGTMSAFYNETAVAAKDKWRVAAIILFLAGVLAIFYYLATAGSTGFGNQGKITPGTTNITYHVLP